MFRMYGRVVQVYRWQSTAVEMHPDEGGAMIEETVTHYAPTQEEAAALGDNVTPCPLEDDEWMDGLEVADVPSTYDEACRIRDMGQEAYKAQLKKEAMQTPEALHSASADMMEMVVDQELRLTMLELGL